jgi:hypothetical protein
VFREGGRHERQCQAASRFQAPVHPKPEQAHTMPYAPAVHIVGACDLMFLSGATASPLYHQHPRVDAEHVHPHSIEEQTANAMRRSSRSSITPARPGATS